MPGDHDVEVWRSGALYLVQRPGKGRRDGTGRLVDAEAGTVGPLLRVTEIMARVNVSDPWDILPDGEDLPEVVARTVEDMKRG